MFFETTQQTISGKQEFNYGRIAHRQTAEDLLFC